MKTRAAVLRDMGKDWEITELDLDPPRDGEVLIRFVAAGLCLTHGTTPADWVLTRHLPNASVRNMFYK